MEKTESDVMSIGMNCLVDNLGPLDAERFISYILRERSDYTKWQRKYFDQIPGNKLMSDAVQHAKEHPHTGNAKIIIG